LLNEQFIEKSEYLSCVLVTFGHLSSHGKPAITSTASAPPTPINKPPRPPPFGV